MSIWSFGLIIVLLRPCRDKPYSEEMLNIISIGCLIPYQNLLQWHSPVSVHLYMDGINVWHTLISLFCVNLWLHLIFLFHQINFQVFVTHVNLEKVIVFLLLLCMLHLLHLLNLFTLMYGVHNLNFL